jgi:hypothetical protein
MFNPRSTSRFDIKKRCLETLLHQAISSSFAAPVAPRQPRAPSRRPCAASIVALQPSAAALQPIGDKRRVRIVDTVLYAAIQFNGPGAKVTIGE